MSNLKLGEKIPVTLQIADGSSSKFPVASILSPDRSVIYGPFALTHSSGGEYKAASDYIMPEVEYVLVQYVVYTDAGHTIEDTTNGRVTENFSLLELDKDPSGLGAELIAEIDSAEVLGEIEKPDISAELGSLEIESAVEKIEVFSDVDNVALISQVEQKDIDAQIDKDEVS